jgi:hypothetical protein
LDVKAGLGMRDLKAWTILETIAKNNSLGVNNLVCALLFFSISLFGECKPCCCVQLWFKEIAVAM